MSTKQKSGLYRTKITIGHEPDGTPITKYISARTKRELEQERQCIKSYYVDGKAINQDFMFRTYAIQWYAVYKQPHIRPATQSNYRNAINKHLIPAFGDRQIRAIHSVDIQAYINTLAAYSKSQMDKIVMVLHEIFQRAVLDGIIDRDPTAAISRPDCVQGSRRALTPSERARVLDVCANHPDGLLFLLLYYTGMRRSEALGLQWRDIDLAADTIHVQRALTYVGKPILDAPKTKSSDRIIPIPAPLHAVLASAPGVGEQFIICATNGGPLSESTLKRKVTRLVNAIGIPDLTCYIFRHNYLTMLDEAHIAPTTAMRLAGHDDYQTTVKFYTHIQEQQILQAKGDLDNIFDAGK